jgi:hypothetical protein
MGADPVRQRLAPACLGIGVVRGAEHPDEDLGGPDLAGRAGDDGDGLARIVDEHLVAGRVLLAQHRRQPPLEASEQLAKAAVAIACGMDLPILLPEHQKIDARPLQLAGQRRPVGLGAPAEPGLHPGPGKQPVLEGVVGELARQRPGQPGGRRPLEVVLDRAARHA